MPRKAATTLPDFAPVPRKCRRHDGWTPARQRGFIERLADYGSVRAAAQAVGMTPESAYYLRRQEGAGSFRKAWAAALDLGIARIEDVAMERALNGVEVPVHAYGKIIGTRRVYNDRLLMFMLRNRAPGRFAADGPRALNAVDKAMLARLKKEWRREWERGRAIEQAAEDDDTAAALATRLDSMRAREEALMSPETRALREAYEASRRRDVDGRFAFLDNPADEPAASDADDPAIPLPPPGWTVGSARREEDDGWEVVEGTGAPDDSAQGMDDREDDA